MIVGRMPCKFSQFFVEKVNQIRGNITSALQSLPCRQIATRPHVGPALSSFLLVTDDEVRRLLSKMPSKSLLLDVLPCSLLKSCGRVRSCHRQARQLVVPDQQVPVLLQACPGTAAAEEGQSRQLITSELQADIQLVNHIENTRTTGVDAPEARA